MLLLDLNKKKFHFNKIFMRRKKTKYFKEKHSLFDPKRFCLLMMLLLFIGLFALPIFSCERCGSCLLLIILMKIIKKITKDYDDDNDEKRTTMIVLGIKSWTFLLIRIPKMWGAFISIVDFVLSFFPSFFFTKKSWLVR